ncbi:hypothetical protein PCE1_000616 [Barthelona sp. PCE]
MHIKRIILRGFRSYKDETIVGDFSPAINSIVGFNGSGKSNVILALRFLFGEDYRRISQERRKVLIYDTSGHRQLSCSVAVIIDNTDRSFLLDEDEVELKRVLGIKKDEYFINGSRKNYSEISQLLTSSGFMSSNPFYIIKQNSITEIANYRPKEKLHLIETISGTKTYLDRRKVSLKKLQEERNRIQRIDGILDRFKEKLKHLEQEEAVYKEWKMLDLKVKTYETIKIERLLLSFSRETEELEEKKASFLEKSSGLFESIDDLHAKIGMVEDGRAEIKFKIANYENEQDFFFKRVLALTEEKASLSLKIKDLETTLRIQNERVRHDSSEEKQLTSEQRRLKRLIEKSNSVMESLNHQLNEVNSRISERKAVLSVLEDRMYLLQFATVEERVTFVENQITELTATMDDLGVDALKAVLAECTEAVTELTRQMSDMEVKEKELNSSIIDLRMELRLMESTQESTQDYQRLKTERLQLQSELAGPKQKLKELRANLLRTAPGNVQRGVEYVMSRVESESGFDNVIGPVYSLLNCSVEFMTSVSMVAGTQLFSIVCKSLDGLEPLLDEIAAKRGMRVTFIPLSELSPPRKVIHDDPEEAVSLMDFVECEYPILLRHLFGKVLLVDDMRRGVDIGRELRCDIVSLEGDRAFSTGEIRGGHAYRISRMQHAAAIQEVHDSVSDIETRLEEIGRKLSSARVSHENHINRVAKKRKALHVAQSELLELRDGIRQVQEQLSEKTHASFAHEQRVYQAEEEHKKLEMKIELFRNADVENVDLDSQHVHVRTMQSDIDALMIERSVLSDDIVSKRIGINSLIAEMSVVEQLLSDLEQRKSNNAGWSQGSMSLGHDTQYVQESVITELKEQLSHITEYLVEIEAQNSDLTNKLDELHAENQRMLVEYDGYKAHELSLRQRTTDDSGELDSVLYRIALLKSQIRDNELRLRQIGQATIDVDIDPTISNEELDNHLRRAQNAVKEFEMSGVSKTAIGKYDSFVEENRRLQERKEMLERDFDRLEELIDHLDGQRGTRIISAINKVSEQFKQLFLQLEPRGTAECIMYMQDGEEINVDDDVEIDASEIMGFDVQVTYGLGRQNLSTLSGGQKTVLSLALILSMHSVNTVPFFCLDEVDANLDSLYRSAVANLIESLADGGPQFFITSFRDELIEVCDFHFIVEYDEELKVSIAKKGNKTDALAIVQAELPMTM